MPLQFGNCSLDTGQLELRRDDEVISVEPQVFSLLAYLIEHRDRVISKDELITEVWQGRIVSDATLNSRINLARRAVGDSGKDQAVIRTFPRRGFRFVADVYSDQVNAGNRKPANDKPAIAVLPLVNLSEDAEQQYFSDGMTQDIITELSRFRELMVIAAHSSFEYRRRPFDLSAVREGLGVDFIVDGNVRKMGGTLRLTASLIETANGSHIWSERFDVRLDRVFEIQDELTLKIVSTLSGRVDEAVAERARRVPTSDIGAYDYLLRAYWEYWHDAEDEVVLSLLDSVTASDPDCAQAYALKGLVLGYGILSGGRQNEKTALDFRESVEKALSLDDRDARVQALAAMAYLFSGKHERALHHSERAIAINPNSIDAIHYRGIVLQSCGQPELGLEYLNKSMQLDPCHPDSYYEPLLEANYLLHRYGDAVSVYERWREIPLHVKAEGAACYAQLGDKENTRRVVMDFESERSHYDFVFEEYLARLLTYHARQIDRDHWLDGFRKAGLIA